MLWLLWFYSYLLYVKALLCVEARRGSGAQSVTVKPTGCGFDSYSRR